MEEALAPAPGSRSARRRQRGGPHRARAGPAAGPGRPPRHRAPRRQRRAEARRRQALGRRRVDMKGGLAVMLELATTVAEPGRRRDLVLLRPRGGRPGRAAACSSLASAPISWPATPPSWASPPAGWSRPGARAACGPDDAHGRPGPHGAAVHRAQRHPPAGRRCSAGRPTGGARGGARRLCLHRAAPGGRCGGGVAGNVVPDGPRSCSITATPPTTGPRGGGVPPSAGRPVLELDGDDWELLDAADGAPPALGHPLLAALVERAAPPPWPRWGGPTWRRSGRTGAGGQLRPR